MKGIIIYPNKKFTICDHGKINDFFGHYYKISSFIVGENTYYITYKNKKKGKINYLKKYINKNIRGPAGITKSVEGKAVDIEDDDIMMLLEYEEENVSYLNYISGLISHVLPFYPFKVNKPSILETSLIDTIDETPPGTVTIKTV